MGVDDGSVRWLAWIAGAAAVVCVPWLLGAATTEPARQPVSCRFGRGQWNPGEWTMIRRPDEAGSYPWTQRDDCIENTRPAATAPAAGAGAPWVYVAMVRKTPVQGDLTVASTMDFQGGLAPSITLTYEIEKDDQGRPVHRQNVEVVLYKEGVNVWRQEVRNGKTAWTLVVYEKLPLKDGTRYAVEVARKGKMMEVRVEGHTLGWREETLPDSVYVGIAGYEGINRFYDFSLK